MTNYAVVIISPPGYIHSATFREVAETVNQGLNNLGHNSVIRLAPTPDRQNIVFGSNLLPSYPVTLEPNSILYNLEHIERGSEWVVPKFLELHKEYKTWDFCEWNSKKFAGLGVNVSGILPMGYVKQATKFTPLEEKEFDVVFVGSMSPRRANILKLMELSGLKVKWVWNCYGADRDRYLMRSKLVLNAHANETPKILEIVRLSHYFANKVPVISERGCNWNEYESTYGDCAEWSTYGELVDRALALVKNTDRLNQLTENAYNTFTQIPIEPYLKELLEKEA